MNVEKVVFKEFGAFTFMVNKMYLVDTNFTATYISLGKFVIHITKSSKIWDKDYFSMSESGFVIGKISVLFKNRRLDNGN